MTFDALKAHFVEHMGFEEELFGRAYAFWFPRGHAHARPEHFSLMIHSLEQMEIAPMRKMQRQELLQMQQQHSHSLLHPPPPLSSHAAGVSSTSHILRMRSFMPGFASSLRGVSAPFSSSSSSAAAAAAASAAAAAVTMEYDREHYPPRDLAKLHIRMVLAPAGMDLKESHLHAFPATREHPCTPQCVLDRFEAKVRPIGGFLSAGSVREVFPSRTLASPHPQHRLSRA